MKKNFYILSLLAAASMMMTTFVSCGENDDDEIIVPSPTPTPDVDPDFNEAMVDSAMQVLFDLNTVADFEIKDHNVYSTEEMANLIFGIDGSNGAEDYADAKKAFLDRCQYIADSLSNDMGTNGLSIDFDNYKFQYTTIDENNNPLTLSAWMCWGTLPIFGPLASDHIDFVCPYTHTKNEECATESNGGVEAKSFFSSNLFIVPDGQGFGVNRNAPQSYLAHHLHAQQYYDCLVAADRIYRQKGGKYEKNWDLHVVGASQGGGDAVSLHKYLETHEYVYDLSSYYDSGSARDRKLADEICRSANVRPGTRTFTMSLSEQWRLAYSFACCGPYTPEATLKEYFKWGKLSYPCVLPMVLKTMLAINPELASKYDETEFYSDLYKVHKDTIDKVLLEKTMISLELNIYMRKLLALDNEPNGAPELVPIDRILSPQMLDTDSEMCKDMMAALAKENLNYGWTPKKECHLYTCQEDEVVPYKNSELLIEFLGDKAVVTESSATSHAMACLYFFSKSW